MPEAAASRSSTSSLTNFFRYPAREFDSETGLYYYRARYYDPSAGRFISEDPLRLYGNDVNYYRYVWGSVTNLRDPLGLLGVGVTVGAGAFAGGGPGIGGSRDRFGPPPASVRCWLQPQFQRVGLAYPRRSVPAALQLCPVSSRSELEQRRAGPTCCA